MVYLLHFGRRITCDSDFGSLATRDHLRLVRSTFDVGLGSLVPSDYLHAVVSSIMGGVGGCGGWGVPTFETTCTPGLTQLHYHQGQQNHALIHHGWGWGGGGVGCHNVRNSLHTWADTSTLSPGSTEPRKSWPISPISSIMGEVGGATSIKYQHALRYTTYRRRFFR